MTAPQTLSNTPQSHTKSLHLHCGHNAEVLKLYPDCHFDAIVTDPPYGIEFLGKDWDSHTGAVETWQQCFRVLKPGGHLLAFSAARTYHHLATNIESTGFEIRDQLMWIYSSGFPKAQDIGKALDKRGITNQSHGWKTALKPGHEPIVMARRPMRGSTIDNVLQHGVGALNIDASRIPYEDQQDLNTYINNIAGPLERSTAQAGDTIQMHEGKTGFKVQRGKVKRPQAGNRTASFSFGDKETQSGGDGSPEFEANPQGRYPSNVIGEITDYQKYFYCPKVSRKERHCGFEQQSLPDRLCGPGGNDWVKSQEHQGNNKKTDSLSHKPTNSDGMMSKDAQGQLVNNYTAKKPAVGNNHPTVKPVALMRYLIQLVTPANSKVLDPFMGSGSTGMAAVELGHTFVGIDLDPAYVSIAQKRIKGWVRTETKKSDQSETAANVSPTDLWADLFE